ncbi:MAG TPA: YchJ family metal-binding protein [Burkholderiaceae bacterium]|jgi:SEC-C motif-containing protein|nr:YchJ family metal-binding protein [Burkholderiaceae bacterium]
MTKPSTAGACPCGGAHYAQCCGRFHQGEPVGTAEQLMRSRYSAYALGLMDYVYRTWHPSTRPAPGELDTDGAVKWLGLDVKRVHAQSTDEATVEFVARYRENGGRARRLHEISRFVRENGQWFYMDGSFPETK